MASLLGQRAEAVAFMHDQSERWKHSALRAIRVPSQILPLLTESHPKSTRWRQCGRLACLAATVKTGRRCHTHLAMNA